LAEKIAATSKGAAKSAFPETAAKKAVSKSAVKKASGKKSAAKKSAEQKTRNQRKDRTRKRRASPVSGFSSVTAASTSLVSLTFLMLPSMPARFRTSSTRSATFIRAPRTGSPP